MIGWALSAAVALADPPALEAPRLLEPLSVAWPDAGDPARGEVIVVVELLVGHDGSVREVVPVSGDEPYLGAVVAAARTLRLAPATEGGAAVEAWVPLTVTLVPPAPPVVVAPVAPAAAPEGIVGTYRVGREEVGRRTLDAAALQATPGSLGDPLRALTSLPGTTRPPLESGWLLVRGGEPTHTAVLVDGVRVPLIYHLGGFTSILHPALVDRVDFLPGGGGVRYGQTLAGTVDVVTRRAGPAPEVRGGANLVFAGAYASAPLGPVRASAAVRRSYLDAVLAPLLPEGSAGAVPRFWDWQARAEAGPVLVLGLGASDAIDLPLVEGTGALRVDTQRVHARVVVPVGVRELRIEPAVAWESLTLDVQDGTLFIGRERLGGAVRVELPDSGRNVVDGNVGVDLDLAATRVRYDEVERRAPAGTPAVYADLRLGKAAQLILGARVDTLGVAGQPVRAGFGPRLAGRLPFGSGAGVELEASGRYAAPAWELVLARPEGAALELDQAWGGSVGTWWAMGPVRARMEAYGRHLPVLAELEADGSLDQGEGLAYGAELSGELHQGRWDAQARVAWGVSGHREDPDEDWVPSDYDQPLSLGMAGRVDLGRGWSLGARFRYGSGYPAGSDTLEVVDALTATRVAVTPVEGRVEPFHALDLKVARRFSFRTWRLDAYLDLQNTYNRRVPEPLVTGLAEVGVSDMGFGLPVLPVFGVEGTWLGRCARPGAAGC